MLINNAYKQKSKKWEYFFLFLEKKKGYEIFYLIKKNGRPHRIDDREKILKKSNNNGRLIIGKKKTENN